MTNDQSSEGGYSNQHQQGSNRGRRGRGDHRGAGSGRGAPRSGQRGGGRHGAAANGQPSTTNGDNTGQNRTQHHKTGPHRPQAPESLHGPAAAVPHQGHAPNGNGEGQPSREGSARPGARRGRGKGRGGARASGSRDPSVDPNSNRQTSTTSTPPSLDAQAPAFQPSHVSAPTSPVIFVPELPSEESGRTQSERGKARPKKPRQPKSQPQSQPKTPEVPANSRSARRAAFEQGAKLTKPESAEAAGKGDQKAAARAKVEKRPVTEADDLIDRLTRGLGKSPFFECPICYNAVTPSQQIWCCLPPDSPPPSNMAPGSDVKDPKIAIAHYQACYTPFHYTCIRDWSRRNLEEETSRLRAIDSQDEPVWRCPGCQKRRPDRIPPYRYVPLTCMTDRRDTVLTG